MVSALRQAHLLTRGTARGLDYDFLGAAPASLWWHTLNARELIMLEQPEAVAYGDGRSLSVLLSGIPSARRDVIGTSIWYTLVVDGLRADADDTALARQLIVTGLSDENRALLGRRLDETFKAAEIDAILGGSGDSSKVRVLLDELLCSGWGVGADPGDAVSAGAGGAVVASAKEMAAVDSGQSWAAPAESSRSRADFLTRVQALAEGTAGFAFTSHTVTSNRGAEAALRELRGTNAILVVDGDLNEVVLGKAEAEAPHRLSRKRLAGTVAGAIVVIALILVLVFLI
jgi:hypothetical protein